MKIAYLMNSYPMTSTTFIRREIHALEAMGLTIARYAIRPWPVKLVDHEDIAEEARTAYLLTGRMTALLGDFLRELATNPIGLARCAVMTACLIRNAGGGIVRHTAYLLEAISLKRRCRADGIAHLHTHFSTNSAAVAMLSRRMGGPRFSFTAHGPDEFVDPGASSLAMKIDHAAFAVAITHFCRMTLVQAAGMAAWTKVHIVRCGVDLAAFTPTDHPFDGNAELVCVGRLCPQKGQVLIPAAVEAVMARHPQIKVALIGDGESREMIETEIASRGLSDRIELLGWQTNDAVRTRIGQARALLLPSFAEGLPIVLMEALALGRPVLTTYIAGIPELVDNACGWIVPASDEEALADALDAALSAAPEILATMGREGRARVEAKHDQTANAAHLKALFEQTVNG